MQVLLRLPTTPEDSTQEEGLRELYMLVEWDAVPRKGDEVVVSELSGCRTVESVRFYPMATTVLSNGGAYVRLEKPVETMSVTAIVINRESGWLTLDEMMSSLTTSPTE